MEFYEYRALVGAANPSHDSANPNLKEALKAEPIAAISTDHKKLIRITYANALRTIVTRYSAIDEEVITAIEPAFQRSGVFREEQILLHALKVSKRIDNENTFAGLLRLIEVAASGPTGNDKTQFATTSNHEQFQRTEVLLARVFTARYREIYQAIMNPITYGLIPLDSVIIKTDEIRTLVRETIAEFACAGISTPKIAEYAQKKIKSIAFRIDEIMEFQIYGKEVTPIAPPPIPFLPAIPRKDENNAAAWNLLQAIEAERDALIAEYEGDPEPDDFRSEAIIARLEEIKSEVAEIDADIAVDFITRLKAWSDANPELEPWEREPPEWQAFAKRWFETHPKTEARWPRRRYQS